MINADSQTFDLMGLSVKDVNGTKIGDVSGYYFDEPTGQVEWLVVSSGMMGNRSLVAPLEGMVREGDNLLTLYEKAQIQEAPEVDAASIDFETETALYRHFNLRRELPGRSEDEPPWQQDDSVAKSHRLRAAGTSQTAGT